MGKEKITHIFEFLRHANITSGKTVVFTETELKAIKHFCFHFKSVAKKIKHAKKRKKTVGKKVYHKKKKSKIEIYEQRLKNLAKARKARKSKRS